MNPARQAAQEAANKTTATRRIGVLRALTATLAALGHKLDEFDETHPEAALHRVDEIYTSIRVSEDRGGGRFTFDSHNTGKLRLTFGDIGGGTRQFPEPKAGFDIVKLANEISTFIKARIERDAERARVKLAIDATEVVAKKINAEFHRKDWTNSRGLMSAGKYGGLYVKLERECTEAQARMILAAIDGIFGTPKAATEETEADGDE